MGISFGGLKRDVRGSKGDSADRYLLVLWVIFMVIPNSRVHAGARYA